MTFDFCVLIFNTMFNYKIIKKSQKSDARIGVFSTPHGNIKTPVFMPVGTVGAVKTMRPDDLENIGAQIILANTYHLYLRPGHELIRDEGGLHKFTKWKKPILTDSGGFQVFSLGESKVAEREIKNKIKPAEISNDGVIFYSHLDGKKHFITPEKSIQIQEDLGADIIMAFDECKAAGSNIQDTKKAVNRTHDWLKRCIAAKTRNDQALFPICQGGTNKKLREESAKFINSLGLPGNAIGGVSVGESKQKIYKVTKWCAKFLDENKPRYLMGIGYPEDISEVIKLGIDMFDCVLPTRLARHGAVWLKDGCKNSQLKAKCCKKIPGLNYGYSQINLKKSASKNDSSPLSETCQCYTCKTGFSRSYLGHLISEKEPLGVHLLTIHNLNFVFKLVEDINRSIEEGKF